MAKYAVTKSFYAGARWQRFRTAIMLERNMTCEECGGLITSDRDAEVHHVVELTPNNIQDANIALNPLNVRLLHHACHDKQHNRFGGYSKVKQVFIVYGCPGSGKTTYVKQNVGRSDLVVCMDSLYQAITGLPEHDKPDNLLMNVRTVYNLLLDQVKTRLGKWSTAWVIGGFADKYQRDKLADELGAEIVFCECSKEEAYARIELDECRRNMAAEYKGYVDEWFSKHVP